MATTRHIPVKFNPLDITIYKERVSSMKYLTQGNLDYARELAATVAGPSGSGMWTTPLSATGQEPATHWISAGLISEDFAALLPLTTYPEDAEPITTPGNPEAVAAQ